MAITRVDRDTIFLFFAMGEIRRALDALEEVKRLSTICVEVAPNVHRREWLSVFNALRSALHFASTASRIFWPPRKAAAHRGQRLRDLIGLPERHPLKARTLRDHIEHLDERLDAWTEQSPREFTTIEMNLQGDEPSHTREAILRSVPVIYFEDSHELWVLGDTYKLDELQRALEDAMSHISAHMVSR